MESSRGLIMTAQFGLALIAAYFLGSLPFASMATHRVRGIDIRQVGDGNPGGKNVFEQIHPLAGVIVVLLDIGKGMVALWLACSFGLSSLALLWIGVAAVAGHNWSIFLQGRGGQGMATTVGVFFSLFPMETLIAILAAAVLLGLIRNWDLALGIGFATLPVLEWWTRRPSELILYTLLLLLLIPIRKWMQRVPVGQAGISFRLPPLR
jgi:glycerol-3-phosphate acyltransferase PlsY